MTATAGPGAPEAFGDYPPTALDRLSAGRPWVAPAILGAVVGVATAYTAWQDPNAGGIFPACPLKELTGLDCPGCGGLRATHALTHGQIGDAFGHNAVVAVVLPLVALVWAAWMLRAIRTTVRERREAANDPVPHRPAFATFPLRFPSISSPVWKLAIALVVVFAVVRNIGGVPVLEYLNSDV